MSNSRRASCSPLSPSIKLEYNQSDVLTRGQCKPHRVRIFSSSFKIDFLASSKRRPSKFSVDWLSSPVAPPGPKGIRSVGRNIRAVEGLTACTTSIGEKERASMKVLEQSLQWGNRDGDESSVKGFSWFIKYYLVILPRMNGTKYW